MFEHKRNGIIGWRLDTSSPTIALALLLGVFTIVWDSRSLSLRVVVALLLGVFTSGCNKTGQSQNDQSGAKGVETVMIDNREPRRDTQGEIIDAHDGCLQFFNGRFYLYGTAYGMSHNYELTNHSYCVYSSPDLGHWTYEGELLHGQPNGVYFRPYVVFNPKTRKYVLWYNWYARNWEGQTGAAVSDTPTGPFTVVNPNVQLSHLHPGDGSLFVDDDGTGYYIYTAIGEGYTVRVERLTPDYLASTGEASSALASGGEAPLLFRRGNVYYALCGPLCDACPQGSEVQSYSATSPMGPFSPRANINRQVRYDATHAPAERTNGLKVLTPGGTPMTNTTDVPYIPAQETWVARIPTSEGPVFMWMADRWGSSPDGYKGHDFQFWELLKFGPDGAILPLRGITRWYISRPP